MAGSSTIFESEIALKKIIVDIEGGLRHKCFLSTLELEKGPEQNVQNFGGTFEPQSCLLVLAEKREKRHRSLKSIFWIGRYG